MLYHDEISRVSMPQVRVQFPPRVFANMKSVKLCHGAQVCVVEIVDAPATSFGGRRRWFRCPRCSANTSTIGFVYDGVGCRRCMGWRARPHRREGDMRAPHLRAVSAAGVDAPHTG